MRISDWSSDVCSSDLREARRQVRHPRVSRAGAQGRRAAAGCARCQDQSLDCRAVVGTRDSGLGTTGPRDHGTTGPREKRKATGPQRRSEEHTSELQSLMRISYAVFCLKKQTNNTTLNVQTREKDDENIRKN